MAPPTTVTLPMASSYKRAHRATLTMPTETLPTERARRRKSGLGIVYSTMAILRINTMPRDEQQAARAKRQGKRKVTFGTGEVN